MSKGYKVVTNYYGSLRSCLIDDHQNCAYYHQDEWVMPVKGGGPLCLFSNIAQAINFKMMYGINSEIWKCDYEPSYQGRIWIAGNRGMFKPLCNLPNGTILADKVMLTRRVA